MGQNLKPTENPSAKKLPTDWEIIAGLGCLVLIFFAAAATNLFLVAVILFAEAIFSRSKNAADR